MARAMQQRCYFEDTAGLITLITYCDATVYGLDPIDGNFKAHNFAASDLA